MGKLPEQRKIRRLGMSESEGGPVVEGMAGSSTIDSEERGREDSLMAAFKEPPDEEWNEILLNISQKSPQERASGRNVTQVKGDEREIRGLGSGYGKGYGKGKEVAETDELAGPKAVRRPWVCLSCGMYIGLAAQCEKGESMTTDTIHRLGSNKRSRFRF